MKIAEVILNKSILQEGRVLVLSFEVTLLFLKQWLFHLTYSFLATSPHIRG
jgi:hypothetical protein